jgi:hypothetical protein
VSGVCGFHFSQVRTRAEQRVGVKRILLWALAVGRASVHAKTAECAALQTLRDVAGGQPNWQRAECGHAPVREHCQAQSQDEPCATVGFPVHLEDPVWSSAADGLARNDEGSRMPLVEHA